MYQIEVSKYRLGHGDKCIALYGISELEFVCRSCETDAVRRPTARPFVQDAQSAVRLPESRSKRSRDRLSGTLGIANESPCVWAITFERNDL